MSVLTRLSRWLFGRKQPAEERLRAALEAFHDPAADTLDLRLEGPARATATYTSEIVPAP